MPLQQTVVGAEQVSLCEKYSLFIPSEGTGGGYRIIQKQQMGDLLNCPFPVLFLIHP